MGWVAGVRHPVTQGCLGRTRAIRRDAMTVPHDLELPIEPLKLDGTALRGLEERKEDNNRKRIEVAEFDAGYEPIKDKVVTGLTKIASITF